MPKLKPKDEVEAISRQMAELAEKLKVAEKNKKRLEADENQRRKLLLGDIFQEFMLANQEATLTVEARKVIEAKKLSVADKALLEPLTKGRSDE
jgi:hypothetical protein